MRISVLLPTRGRTDTLLRSIDSLLTKASQPDQIEILLALDRDDTASLQYVHEVIADRWPNNIHVYQMDPLGYSKLNIYYNTLAGLAWGYWLMVWNDDALMDTAGWDDLVDQHRNHPMPLLRIPCANFEHPFALFPIIKKEWFNVCGTFSYYAHVDRFVYNMSQNLGDNVLTDIAATVTHDRADITGNNRDATFDTSFRGHDRYNPEDPFSDEYYVSFQVVMHMVNRLRKHLNDHYGHQIPLSDLTKPLKIVRKSARSHNLEPHEQQPANQ
jgi:glycosyltransferase involved in cell wall biosynthesis